MGANDFTAADRYGTIKAARSVRARGLRNVESPLTIDPPGKLPQESSHVDASHRIVARLRRHEPTELFAGGSPGGAGHFAAAGLGGQEGPRSGQRSRRQLHFN